MRGEPSLGRERWLVLLSPHHSFRQVCDKVLYFAFISAARGSYVALSRRLQLARCRLVCEINVCFRTCDDRGNENDWAILSQVSTQPLAIMLPRNLYLSLGQFRPPRAMAALAEAAEKSMHVTHHIHRP